MKKREYISMVTGEYIEGNILSIIKVVILDLWIFHVINLKWKRYED